MLKKTKNNSEDNIKKLLKDQTEKLTEIFDDRIKTVQEEFNGINKKLDSHTKTLNSHTDQIGGILVNLTVIKADIKEIKSELKNKADKTEISLIGKRISVLESRN